MINADSMQVYRELRILTARPTLADETLVPHRLFGVLPASEACSAGRWLAMAAPEIERARSEGRLAIVVGGTGLYLEALMAGLAPVPAVPEEIRAEARTLHARIGGEEFRRRLAELDAETAARLNAGDSQRLIRAFEVIRATGRTLADWRGQAPYRPVDAHFPVITLLPPRDELHAAIDARFDRMLDEGGITEVRALQSLGLDPRLPAMKAVGVPELIRHLRGEISLDEARAKAKTATRRYAKRQATWFRHRLEAAKTFPARYSVALRLEIAAFVGHFVLTGEK